MVYFNDYKSDALFARPEGTLLQSEATKRNDPFASLSLSNILHKLKRQWV